MRNTLLFFYILIIIVTKTSITRCMSNGTTNATSSVSITPSGQLSVIIEQRLNFTCTAKLKDAQGQSLYLLTFGQVGMVWPQYFLVPNSNQDYLVDDGNQPTISSYYNKSSTDMMIGITIENITKNHSGIYKCAASYLPDGTLQDEVTVKVNVLGKLHCITTEIKTIYM